MELSAGYAVRQAQRVHHEFQGQIGGGDLPGVAARCAVGALG